MITEAGMFDSDRCKFCAGFFVKAKPYICVDCWREIQEVVNQYNLSAQQTHADRPDDGGVIVNMMGQDVVMRPIKRESGG